VLDEGFRGVCRFAAEHPRVLARTAEILAMLSERLGGYDAAVSIARVAGWIRFALERSATTADDRALVEDRLRLLSAARRPAGDEPTLPSVH
jgi:hypothetical protein